MEFILPTVFIICVLIHLIWSKQCKQKSLEWRRKNNTIDDTYKTVFRKPKRTVENTFSDSEDTIGIGDAISLPEDIIDDSFSQSKAAKSAIYEQLLIRKEWKEKRAKIMARDNNCCRYCKSRHNLQVHHKYYLQYPNHEKVLPWKYKDDALITLCDKCHKRWHAKHTVKTYYVSRYYQSPLQEN